MLSFGVLGLLEELIARGGALDVASVGVIAMTRKRLKLLDIRGGPDFAPAGAAGVAFICGLGKEVGHRLIIRTFCASWLHDRIKTIQRRWKRYSLDAPGH